MAKKIRVDQNEYEEYLKNVKLESSVHKKYNFFSSRKIIWIFAFLIVLVYVLFTIYKSIPVDINDVIESVVKVEIYDSNNELIASGSGFCAYESNYIVTNFHVIEEASSIKIIDNNNNTYDVKNVLIFDKKNDLAILDTNADLNPIKFGSFGDLEYDSDVTAIGSPNGKLNTISYGKILEKDSSGVLTSAPTYSGSSGGVLLNDKNRLVGITSSGNEKKGLNYSISVNYLRKLNYAFFTENYFIIDWSNYYDCTTSFDKIEKAGKIEFTGCGTDDKYYSVIGMNAFSKVFDFKSVYESNIEDELGWYDIYNSLSKKQKNRVIAVYEKLLERKYCKGNCNISSDLKSWSAADFFVNLDILKEYELALVIVDMNRYSDFSSRYDRVDDYPLDAAEVCLILWLIGDGNWDDITEKNKEDIFDYLNEKDLSTKELGKILKWLGYDVKYNSDGTLTAYWN